MTNYLLMLSRGLFLRCARCGAAGLFRRWTTMVDACPRCRLNFEHEEGYWVGAMTLNIVVTELLFALLTTIAVIATWPDIPVLLLIGIGVAINALFPILFYPISKTLWVAIDLAFFHPLPPISQRPEDARPLSIHHVQAHPTERSNKLLEERGRERPS